MLYLSVGLAFVILVLVALIFMANHMFQRRKCQKSAAIKHYQGMLASKG